MPVVNVHEAKTHFSKLLKRVMAGEEIIIALGGKPVARLAAGQLRLHDDFDAPLPDDVLAD
jgi:antitoxin (DNA-binding transcriptional repressor) of toxin-antitoxin stability system